MRYRLDPRYLRGDTETLTAIVRDRNGQIVSATTSLTIPAALRPGRTVSPASTSRVDVGGEFNVSEWTCTQQSSAGFTARFAIDALKASAPIWKRETWSDGTDWGTGATAPVPPAAVPSVGGGRS